MCMKKITISYTDEQHEWLEKHPEINKSGAFRRIISYMMEHDVAVISESEIKAISDKIRGE